jgi:peroxiredoxin Q/BCP
MTNDYLKRLFIMASILSLFSSCSNAQKHLSAGDSVPIFSLKNQDDSTFHIKDYIGKKILVIYFYPADETSVCTKEACAFRDSIADFTSAGAMVIGISPDDVASHKAFQKNHNIPFTLLSDPGNFVLKMFGIKKGILSGRETFVIDLSGQIVFTFNSYLKGKEHSDEVLKFLKEMKK